MLFRFRLSLALLVAELVGTVEPVAAEEGVNINTALAIFLGQHKKKYFIISAPARAACTAVRALSMAASMVSRSVSRVLRLLTSSSVQVTLALEMDTAMVLMEESVGSVMITTEKNNL